MKYSIHREGTRAIVINTILWVTVALLFIVFSADWRLTVGAVAACLCLILLMIRFFRVPKRVPTLGDDLIVSPGDGKVVAVKEVVENEFFHCPCMRISIFLSVFNVHVTWYPASGTISYFRYHPGKYLVAWHPKASEKNEHTTVGISTPKGRDLMFRQIAGILARRVVCYAREGEAAGQASQAGFIKFGSRLDVFVPLGTEICVRKGDRVRGQQTVLAIFK